MSKVIETPNSSMFSSYAYDEAAWILTLSLKNGKVYEYLDFGPENFDEFKGAKSLGTYYNSSIKGVFDSREVTNVPVDEVPVKQQSKASVEDDLGITDDDIRLAHPDYVPKEAADIVTAAESDALAEPVRRQPQVEKLQKDWALIPAPISIATAQHYADVSAQLKRKSSIRDAVFNLLDPARAAIYAAYQSVQRRQKEILDPMDASIAADKRLLVAFDNQQREAAAAEQRRLEAEARARADEEQRKRTEELRLQVAQEKADAGDSQGAEASLFDEAIVAPPTPVYVPRVEVETPQVDGMAYRDNWGARVTDFELLVCDVAAGIESMKSCGTLMGHAPTSVLTVSQASLNQLAKANKSMLRIPGVLAENNRVVATRKSKV